MALSRTALFLLCCSSPVQPGVLHPGFCTAGRLSTLGLFPGSDSPRRRSQSLGDIARRLRKDHTAEVQMSAEDAKTLFQSVDKIFAFDSEDTGFPKRSSVKRELVTPADVEKYTRSVEAQARDSRKRWRAPK